MMSRVTEILGMSSDCSPPASKEMNDLFVQPLWGLPDKIGGTCPSPSDEHCLISFFANFHGCTKMLREPKNLPSFSTPLYKTPIEIN